MRWSASVAFYTLLSITPLLVLTVAIAGLFYGKDVAQGELVSVSRRLAGFDVSPAIHILLASPRKPMTGIIAAACGTVILFFGASSVLLELRDALNAIWQDPANPGSTEFADLFHLAKERIYSFLVILGLGVVLVASLALNTCLTALGAFYQWPEFNSGFVFRLTVSVVSFLVVTLVFAGVYKFIPNVSTTWRESLVGGFVTSALFSIGKLLISLYLSWTDLGSAYGAAGSLIVLLVWVYYSAQVFFLGAEFTKVYAEMFGSRKAGPETP
jgi:membrane protein